MKIKILEVCAVDETVKNLLLPLIDRLIKEGFNTTVCCSPGKISAVLSERGYDIRNIKISRSLNIISHFISTIKLFKLIKKERFDIVHVHTPVAALLGRIAAKLAGAPLIIYTAHGFYFHDRMSKLKYKLLVGIEKLAGRLLTHYIFTQSEEDRQTAIKHGIIKESMICTIGNGVDVFGKFNPQSIDGELASCKRNELGIGEGNKVIAFIGRFVREKGILDLLEAFEKIADDDYRLLLIGGHDASGRDKTACKKINDYIRKNKKIIAAGKREDVNYLLFLSDVFVLPSYREGMPRSVIEAMAMSKPVVATNIRGCREEVVHGENGFLVQPGNVEELKDRILEITENPSLGVQMGANGRMRAERLFGEKRAIDIQIRVMRELIKQKLQKVRSCGSQEA